MCPACWLSILRESTFPFALLPPRLPDTLTLAPLAVSPLQLVQCACVLWSPHDTHDPASGASRSRGGFQTDGSLLPPSLEVTAVKLSLNHLCTARHQLFSYAALGLKENYVGFVFPEDREPQFLENRG